jgi:hypothetical protein
MVTARFATSWTVALDPSSASVSAMSRYELITPPAADLTPSQYFRAASGVVPKMEATLLGAAALFIECDHLTFLSRTFGALQGDHFTGTISGTLSEKSENAPASKSA